MPRLEKLLQKPLTVGVGRALAQLLLDWAFLYKCVLGTRCCTCKSSMSRCRHPWQMSLGKPCNLVVVAVLMLGRLNHAYTYRHEELGHKSHAALAASAKHRSLLESIMGGHQQRPMPGAGPSEQASAVAEEVAMGMPPVGPRKPPDFVALYAGEGEAGGC